jgi:MoaA/NifB/PqqE/SkfB family radical SAM enzyme
MYLDPRGEVRACCQNQWQRLGNISEHSLREIWEGEPLRYLREALSVGDFGAGCEFCGSFERQGNPERSFARVYDDWEAPDSDPPWPRQLELALSNACNLQCVMCNGELSSSIRIHREHRSALPEVYGEEFFAELDDFLPHLESVVFLGGEPFLARPSLRVMRRLLELGLSPRCSVTTNGTQWNAEIEHIVSSLPMHLSVSVDGSTPSTLESVRVGVDFDTLMGNIVEMRRVVASTGGSMSISFCMMRTTWHELGSVLEWADGLGLEVFVNSVAHPARLSLVHAPVDELRSILDTMEAEGGERAAMMGRNRWVWDRELENLARMVDGRIVEIRPAVSSAAGRHQDAASDAAAVATLWTDANQVVRSVVVEARADDLPDLESLVGSSIWDIMPMISAGYGVTVGSQLERHADGVEERLVTFRLPDGTSTRVEAAMTPQTDGGQHWSIAFGR